MNRKTFLATLGAALVAPFLPKIAASSPIDQDIGFSPVLFGGSPTDKFKSIDARFSSSSQDIADSLERSRVATNESAKSVEELTKAIEDYNRNYRGFIRYPDYNPPHL